MHFDALPVPSAPLEDLEFFRRVYLPSSLPADVLEENPWSTEHQLAFLCLTPISPEVRPPLDLVVEIGRVLAVVRSRP